MYAQSLGVEREECGRVGGGVIHVYLRFFFCFSFFFCHCFLDFNGLALDSPH